MLRVKNARSIQCRCHRVIWFAQTEPEIEQRDPATRKLRNCPPTYTLFPPRLSAPVSIARSRNHELHETAGSRRPAIKDFDLADGRTALDSIDRASFRALDRRRLKFSR
jgi:hypothetical protein